MYGDGVAALPLGDPFAKQIGVDSVLHSQFRHRHAGLKCAANQLLLGLRVIAAASIAQASDVLRFPGQNVTEQRALEVQLYETLPIPGDTVPFQDILEFRQLYADELQTFRSVLDEMYGEILGAPDPARMRNIIVGKLGSAVRDIENAMQGRALTNWRSTVSVEIKMPEMAVQASVAAALASVIGVPWEIGAALGAAVSAVRLQFTPVPMPEAARHGAFAYLYHAKRELTK